MAECARPIPLIPRRRSTPILDHSIEGSANENRQTGGMQTVPSFGTTAAATAGGITSIPQEDKASQACCYCQPHRCFMEAGELPSSRMPFSTSERAASIEKLPNVDPAMNSRPCRTPGSLTWEMLW
jgi:hypothetical protein